LPRSPNARPEPARTARAGSTAPPRQLAVLPPAECRRLLAEGSVGRLAVVRGGYPVVVPVNYAVHDERIVVRTGPGTKLSGAHQHRVAFEVDSIDEAWRTGWSVLVQGFAVEVTPEAGDLYDEVAAVGGDPWAPGRRDRILVIAPISVTGRRIVPSHSPGR
jgi:uncharacterized protein